jgi:hypothetical protein
VSQHAISAYTTGSVRQSAVQQMDREQPSDAAKAATGRKEATEIRHTENSSSALPTVTVADVVALDTDGTASSAVTKLSTLTTSTAAATATATSSTPALTKEQQLAAAKQRYLDRKRSHAKVDTTSTS